MSTYTEVLTSLPWGVHVGLGLILAAGVTIWAFGKHLLKPTLILAAMATGASVGFVAAAFMPETVSSLWSAGAGVVVFGLVALAVYRFLMAAMLAICLGLACPLGYFTYAELTGMYRDQPGAEISDEELTWGSSSSDGDATVSGVIRQAAEKTAQKADDFIRKQQDILSGKDSDGGGDGAATDNSSDNDGAGRPSWRSRFNVMMRQIAREIGNNWKDAPGVQKVASVLAAFAGIVVGILLGIIAPKLSGAVVTSLVGSLVILGSGSLLALRYDLPVASLGLGSMTGKLAWWFGFSILGLLIQFKCIRHKADKGN